MSKIPYQLLAYGPIRTEARRLAKIALRAELDRKKVIHKDLSDKQWENLITVLLWNSGDKFLNAAKFNLGDHR